MLWISHLTCFNQFKVGTKNDGSKEVKKGSKVTDSYSKSRFIAGNNYLKLLDI